MLLIPVTPVLSGSEVNIDIGMSESEINDNIEIENPSEETPSEIYSFWGCKLSLYSEQGWYVGGVKTTKTGPFTRDFTFYLDDTQLLITSLKPFNFRYLLEFGRCRGKIIGFVGIHRKREPWFHDEYFLDHSFNGFASWVEIWKAP
jgi:hypothetical protein